MAKQNLDVLEQVREMTVLNDKFQKQLSDKRVEAIALAEELYPVETSAGVEFIHKGAKYIVKQNKKWDFSHVTTDPIFSEWRENVKAQKHLKKEYDELMKKILKRFPNLKPKSITKVLNVKR